MTDAAMSAYQEIASLMNKAAPKPFRALHAKLRLDDGSCRAEFSAANDAGEKVFLLPKLEYGALHKALKAINQSLTTTKGPGFSRADFSFDANGTFDFSVHRQDRLLADLAAALRRQWPDGVDRLRLTVRYDSFGRFSLAYESIRDDGRTTFLDAHPPSAAHFDDVRGVVTDVWALAKDKPRELVMELGRTGDAKVSIDGTPI